jgi:flagellar basal-body rod protein FlgB
MRSTKQAMCQRQGGAGLQRRGPKRQFPGRRACRKIDSHRPDRRRAKAARGFRRGGTGVALRSADQGRPGMDALDSFFGISGEALRLRGRRLDIIASNIANAATPNYKARDLDFGAALAAARGPSRLEQTSNLHLGGAPAGGAEALYRVPQQASLDGNTVELASEQVAFAENAVRYETTLSILSGRISTLMSAIKGE